MGLRDIESTLPPGFRFYPSDEELVCHYLYQKVTDGIRTSEGTMVEVDLHACEPWELPGDSINLVFSFLFSSHIILGSLKPMHCIICWDDLLEHELLSLPLCKILGYLLSPNTPHDSLDHCATAVDVWYFFSYRDRKYATGSRTNRATKSGFWKATGKDRTICDPRTQAMVGMRKTLVFYRGRAPNGVKSGWVMHEFRLEIPHSPSKVSDPPFASFLFRILAATTHDKDS
ncbi:hypothetical protein GW17_00056828 [Ensete ventricosum]|nr:hypothetical protein GW17_00056828 [Ensete ventricosum]